MIAFLQKLGAKRLVALLIGPGLLAVALDSAIAHFAGKNVSHPAQLVPLAYGAAAFIVMTVAAIPRVPGAWFRRGLRVVGFTSALVGIAGTWFHLKVIIDDLADETLSLLTLEGAVGLAPPLFAPGAFVAIGALLWVLASPRVQLHFALGGKAPVEADDEAVSRDQSLAPSANRA